VNFAIALALVSHDLRSTREHDGSLPEWRKEVLEKAMIISDDFSVPC